MMDRLECIGIGRSPNFSSHENFQWIGDPLSNPAYPQMMQIFIFLYCFRE